MAKKNKKNKDVQAPMFPGMFPPVIPFPMPVNGDQDEAKAKAKEFKANAKDVWEKSFDMRKASVDSTKDQFGQFFAYMMDLQDGFIETVPEQLPAIPGLPELPLSPKAFMKACKEYEEMINDYLIKQVDSCVEFVFASEQKAVEMIPQAPAAEEEAAEETEEAAEEQAE